MNVPTGVAKRNGKVVSAEPLAPLDRPAAAPESIHMLLAALMCTGESWRGIYAVECCRGPDAYHRRGFASGWSRARVRTAAGRDRRLAARVVEARQRPSSPR